MKSGSAVCERWQKVVREYGDGEKRRPRAPSGSPTTRTSWSSGIPTCWWSPPFCPQGGQTMNVVEFYYRGDRRFRAEFIEAERAAYMETAIEDDDIGERMDRGATPRMKEGKPGRPPIRVRWKTACSISTSSTGGSSRIDAERR